MPRLFFGLEIDPTIKDRLLAIRSPVAGARWQTAAQLHLTLAFVGGVSEAQVDAVHRAGEAVSMAPFRIAVQGIGAFGKPERPRNLWAGVTPEQPVATLHRLLFEALAREGFEREDRRFRPHITLSRFRQPAGSVTHLLAQYGQAAFGEMVVSRFALFQSTPDHQGSRYTAVARFPLVIRA